MEETTSPRRRPSRLRLRYFSQGLPGRDGSREAMMTRTGTAVGAVTVGDGARPSGVACQGTPVVATVATSASGKTEAATETALATILTGVGVLGLGLCS
jgi:hypothetical protein